MNKIANQFTSIEQVTGQYLSQRNPEKLQNQGFSFEEILNQKRTSSESEEQSLRLENGVQKASEKGIKESLVLIDSLAFIVNVPNKTVVTAMDQGESSDNIFTNIDGAVIM